MTSPNVGIIGAGRIGQAMARTALRAGRTVVISNSRGPQTLTSVAKTLGDGVSAGTVRHASAATIVVLAVPWAMSGTPFKASNGTATTSMRRPR